jgi:hypothetical protein
MVIIVSNDLAMNVLVAELESRVRGTNRIRPMKPSVEYKSRMVLTFVS